MTEDEARTKWCPFVRMSVEGITGFNRWFDPEHKDPLLAPCIASACMAWRWLPNNLKNNPPKTGFCGLAGNVSATRD